MDCKISKFTWHHRNVSQSEKVRVNDFRAIPKEVHTFRGTFVWIKLNSTAVLAMVSNVTALSRLG